MKPRTILALVLSTAPLGRAQAQYLTRPHIPWQTIETEHFAIHFPAEMREWTESVAGRMESVAAAVNAIVGNRPAARVTVLVEDPSNVANGFAIPILDEPVIFLWPTPPAPGVSFGGYRDWGEILAVHEYGHIAHLSFPSRNPNERFFWRFMPVEFGPLARKAPAWVIEGYATLIEGRLTAHGRPPSAGRAAILRQWALEGRLPVYGQLNSGGGFLGGAMRYLVGSAFLEWLENRKGDSSLVYLWRRMSARQQRSFGSAFQGVFGTSPDDLYGRFFVEVTAKALDAARTLERVGLVEGELVQKLNAGTGEPAVSPDGKLLALVRRQTSGPSRLVVWNAEQEPVDSAVIRQRQRLLERDPLDVPAIDSFPRPRRELAALHPVSGRSHENPRWMPDGVNILVSRDEPTGEGMTSPDLFLWNHRSGALRRLTRGAAIRHADPSPDGRRIAGVRCHAGICRLVVVDVATGVWRPIAGGGPDTVWHRPRWSPDGSRIAASVHHDGVWRPAIVDAGSGAVRLVDGGDGVSRHSPAFTPSGDALVVVSEHGGIPNLELISLGSSQPRTLTRVTGAALAPAVSRADGRVYFLTLHARGYDLRRLPLDAQPANLVALDPSLAPAVPAPPSRPRTAFATASVPAPKPYALGPRGWRVLPGGAFGPDGAVATIAVANMDPVGRFSVLAQGGHGERGTWRGGSLTMALRRTAVHAEPAAWYIEHDPSEQAAGTFAPPSADVRYTGAGLVARITREASQISYGMRGGASVGTVSGSQLDAAGRLLAFAELRGRMTLTFGRTQLTTHLSGITTAGSTDGQSWQRTVAGAALQLGGRRWLTASAWRGIVTTPQPGEFGRRFEQFLVGGSDPPYIDPAFLSQRVALPALPTGIASGRRLWLYRGAIGGLIIEPYFVWASASDSTPDLRRVAGLEREIALSSLGFVRRPAMRIRVGGGYSFDEPYKYRTRGYVSLTYAP